MDLYKEPPTMELLVLLLAEISNILLNGKTPFHLSPALKGDNQQSVPGVFSNSFSTDISRRGRKKKYHQEFAFSCLYSWNKIPVCGHFKNRQWWNIMDIWVPSVANIFYMLWILAENDLSFSCWTKVLLQGLMSKSVFHFRILPHYKYH